MSTFLDEVRRLFTPDDAMRASVLSVLFLCFYCYTSQQITRYNNHLRRRRGNTVTQGE